VTLIPPLTFGAHALPSYHAESNPPQGEFMRHVIDLLPPLSRSATRRVCRHVDRRARTAHPLAMAEQLASLDLLSNRRLDFGVGRGSEPYDYEAFGIDHGEAQARTMESLEVILAAWTQPRETHALRGGGCGGLAAAPAAAASAGLALGRPAFKPASRGGGSTRLPRAYARFPPASPRIC